MAEVSKGSSRLLIAIALLSFIVMGLYAGLLGVAWPSIRDSFGVPLDAIGSLLLLTMVVALAFSFSSGRMIAGIGLGVLLVVGGAVAGLGFLGTALAPAWWAMVLFGMVASVGTTIINTGLNTYFAIIAGAGLMNWLHACFGLGATISPIVMTAVLSLGHSWRWGYVFVAASYGLLAALYLVTVRHWPLAQPDPVEPASVRPANTGYRESLRLPAVWLSLLLFFTFTGMEGTAGQWPYVLFTEARSIDPVTAGLWVSIYWAGMTAGRMVAGLVVGRVGTIRLVRVCAAGVIAGSALVWWNPSPLLSFIGLALVGFTVSPFFPVLASETRQWVGVLHATNVIGFQITAVRLGLAAIPALVGVLARSIGLEVIGPSMLLIAVSILVLFEATIPRKA